MHRMGMDVIYPKKLVPFNANLRRAVVAPDIAEYAGTRTEAVSDKENELEIQLIFNIPYRYDEASNIGGNARKITGRD